MLRTTLLLMIISASMCSSYPRSIARHRTRPRPGVMTLALPYKREDPSAFTTLPIHRFSSRSSVPIELFVPPFITYEKQEERPFRGFPMLL